ncbi:diguanylate cyclase, partial [gut metagenome]
FTVLLAAMVSFPVYASATVSTREPTGAADTVYVAGNPNWYPVEYYDESSKSYEGILPELLELVTEKTGLKFTYVEAGIEDHRHLLAHNKQVEIVSGCKTGENWSYETGMSISEAVFSIPSEGGKNVEAYFAFTAIADESLIRTIKQVLSGLTASELAGIFIRFLTEHSRPSNPTKTMITSAVIIVLFALTVLLSIKLRRYHRESDKDARVDPLTGIWNKNYFVNFFEKFISDQYRSLYCVVYIAFDIVRVNQYYGEAVAEEQLQFAANELQLSTRENEVVARVSGGGFAVARPSSGEPEVTTWVNQILH